MNQAVAVEISPANIAAVKEHLPEAIIVFNNFHVIKLYNDRLWNLRRQFYHQSNDQRKKMSSKEPAGSC